MFFVERLSPVRIITETVVGYLAAKPRLKRWAWFVAIYGGSVLAFGAVTGVLEFCLPK